MKTTMTATTIKTIKRRKRGNRPATLFSRSKRVAVAGGHFNRIVDREPGLLVFRRAQLVARSRTKMIIRPDDGDEVDVELAVKKDLHSWLERVASRQRKPIGQVILEMVEDAYPDLQERLQRMRKESAKLEETKPQRTSSRPSKFRGKETHFGECVGLILCRGDRKSRREEESDGLEQLPDGEIQDGDRVLAVFYRGKDSHVYKHEFDEDVRIYSLGHGTWQLTRR